MDARLSEITIGTLSHQLFGAPLRIHWRIASMLFCGSLSFAFGIISPWLVSGAIIFMKRMLESGLPGFTRKNGGMFFLSAVLRTPTNCANEFPAIRLRSPFFPLPWQEGTLQLSSKISFWIAESFGSTFCPDTFDLHEKSPILKRIIDNSSALCVKLKHQVYL